MINDADLVGLSEGQARRFEELDHEISQSREGIAAWHRLLDRRRLDRRRGQHPIAEFALQDRPDGGGQGSLRKHEPSPPSPDIQRAPFYLRTEAEARGLLIRCIGYLSDVDGNKLAGDKGYGERDKMAEWMLHEIREFGGLAYITRHAPYVFGIRLAAATA